MNTKRSWVSVAVYEHEGEARKLERFLQGRKFEARTYDDKVMRALLFLRPPQKTHRVQVRMNDFKVVAHLVTQDAEAGELLEDSLHCPDCGSLHVQYPQMTRRFVLPTVLLHAGILLRIIDHEAYCEHCHFVWHLTGQPVVVPQAVGVQPK
jgi:hypothetical protein